MIGQGKESSNQRRHDYVEEGVTVGFFTDPSLCIGCKACEVACKEWNQVPSDGFEWTGMSYDNTASLGASTWRHVLFLEQDAASANQVVGADPSQAPFRWIFFSDVCKHCERAGCLESCPTGAIVRTEVGSVFVQDDVCNGCGYCVVSCPFGVIDRREPPSEKSGGAFKCTFCYDRQKDGLTPACVKVCPTESIRFGPLEDLRREADARVRTLRERGHVDVAIYDPSHPSVGGTHALSLLMGEPERYGLPDDPQMPMVHLRAAWTAAAVTAVGAIATVIAAVAALGSAS